MPELIRPALFEARSRIFDSARWAGYQPRQDDIVIATYPKCGTTWTQRIVSMLLSGSAEPAPIVSPWFDMRLFGPVEGQHALAQSLTTRRFLKSHLPYDALPVYAGMKFIHVARDGRDSAMSLHNHMTGFTRFAWDGITAISVADPKFGDAMEPATEDPAAFFHAWIKDGGDMGDPACSYWHMERSYWAARQEPNVLLVHYNDLKADRGGEMRRIAAFLEADVPESAWPAIVEAAGFEAMREAGPILMQGADQIWEGGAKRFLFKGTNGRWQDVVGAADLAAYAAKVKAEFEPELASWLEGGRLMAGDPAAV